MIFLRDHVLFKNLNFKKRSFGAQCDGTHPVIPTLRRLRQEDQSSRPV
jgi:hypothetical protein